MDNKTNIKLMKQNAYLILFITNFINTLEENKKTLEKDYHYPTKYLDIKIFTQYIDYFKQCLEECNK